MKASFSAIAALSLLPLLASVTNALPNPAVSAEINAVKARTPSPVGIAITYIEPQGNLKNSRSLTSTDIPTDVPTDETSEGDKTSEGDGNSNGEFTISATEGMFCFQGFAEPNFKGKTATMCCGMSQGCCKFIVPFTMKSAIAPSSMTPAGGVYIWPKADCTTDNFVRWVPNEGVSDMSKEPRYYSMSLPQFFRA